MSGINLLRPTVPDYYGDLGVSQQASPRDIRLAFHKLAKQHHPDKKAPGQTIDAHEFRKIHEAYEILRNKDKRDAYDVGYPDLRYRWQQYREASGNPQKYEARIRMEQQMRDHTWMAEQKAKYEAFATFARQEQARRVREMYRCMKIRMAEQEAARKAREQQEQAAKARLRDEKAKEAELRSQQVAAKARAEQERVALERLRADKQHLEERRQAFCRHILTWLDQVPTVQGTESGKSASLQFPFPEEVHYPDSV
ncbi:DnaJ domain-containing protein [Hypoxylon rubiginosum]|uniref:DnaJ domain-containing protein n=1 Tax=Hypoxylon rubiginosum TaxID=110542 RepID=A0ACC0CNG1_9PEZI|nr:DnaJ domain-containing protein [Hypoxylon rubiginosum]